MRSVVTSANQTLEDVERPPVEIPAGFVRIHVAFCGVCGSEMHIREAETTQNGSPVGTVLGHEFAATISGLAAGGRVRGLGRRKDHATHDPGKWIGSGSLSPSQFGALNGAFFAVIVLVIPLLTLLIQSAGWRSLFVVLTVVGLLVALLFAFFGADGPLKHTPVTSNPNAVQFVPYRQIYTSGTFFGSVIVVVSTFNLPPLAAALPFGIGFALTQGGYGIGPVSFGEIVPPEQRAAVPGMLFALGAVASGQCDGRCARRISEHHHLDERSARRTASQPGQTQTTELHRGPRRLLRHRDHALAGVVVELRRVPTDGDHAASDHLHRGGPSRQPDGYGHRQANHAGALPHRRHHADPRGRRSDGGNQLLLRPGRAPQPAPGGTCRPSANSSVDRSFLLIQGSPRGAMGAFDTVGMRTAFNVMSHWGTVNGDEQMLAALAELD